MRKKSPTEVKGKVIGSRYTVFEVAAIDVLRGDLTPSTWVAELVRREIRKLSE